MNTNYHARSARTTDDSATTPYFVDRVKEEYPFRITKKLYFVALVNSFSISSNGIRRFSSGISIIFPPTIFGSLANAKEKKGRIGWQG